MMARRSTIFLWRIAVLSLAIFGGCLYAQEKPNSPEPQTTATAETPATATAETPVKTKAKDKEANDDVPKRIFWIIPNFMTANDQPQNLGPLTPKQKFNIAWHQWWDISAHIGNLVQASISQAVNGIPEYGQGWGAFGERYAAEEGDQFTGAMLIYGVLPSLLHDDPRYFRKGRGSTWYRIGYAASRTVICRTDSGKNTFNIPQVFGQLGQASISLTYYPQVNRNIGGLFSGWAINQLYNIGWNQLKEFTPDLGAYVNRRYKKKHKAAEINDNRSPISPTN
jgi:hypothetical protein